MQCCNDDGLILKPSAPATAIDAWITGTAFNDSSQPAGQVYTTYCLVDGYMYGVILAADMQDDYALTPEGAGFMAPSLPTWTDGVQYSVDRQGNVSVSPLVLDSADDSYVMIDDEACLTLDGAGCLIYTAPFLNVSGRLVALLGDLTKVVP